MIEDSIDEYFDDLNSSVLNMIANVKREYFNVVKSVSFGFLFVFSTMLLR